VLTAERTALNFLCHLSGVATATRRLVDAVTAANPRTQVWDTRKTLPGLRAVEKAAVRAGGGANHRGSLSDMVLVKDNHLAGMSITQAVGQARRHWPGRTVEVECERIEQVRELPHSDPSRVTIADFMLAKDSLFAGITLDAAEPKLYDALYAHLRPQAPIPDLVLYLQADPEILLERVHRRHAQFERGITLEYLTKLSAAYARFFYDYSSAPLLIVNSENLNFVDRDADFELLLQRVRDLKGAREYFNMG